MNELNNAVKSQREFILLCKTLSTDVAYKALLSLLEGPKSVADICLENKTPVSSTYKVVKGFQQMGLVSVQDVLIDEHGKRITLYKAKVKSLRISLNASGVKLEYGREDGENDSSMSSSSDEERNSVSVVIDDRKSRKETHILR